MTDAEKREKVIRGLEAHANKRPCTTIDGTECPYYNEGRAGCSEPLANDALALLREQEERIKFLEKWVCYLEGGDPYEGNGVLSHD